MKKNILIIIGTILWAIYFSGVRLDLVASNPRIFLVIGGILISTWYVWTYHLKKKKA